MYFNALKGGFCLSHCPRRTSYDELLLVKKNDTDDSAFQSAHATQRPLIYLSTTTAPRMCTALSSVSTHCAGHSTGSLCKAFFPPIVLYIAFLSLHSLLLFLDIAVHFRVRSMLPETILSE